MKRASADENGSFCRVYYKARAKAVQINLANGFDDEDVCFAALVVMSEFKSRSSDFPKAHASMLQSVPPGWTCWVAAALSS